MSSTSVYIGRVAPGDCYLNHAKEGQFMIEQQAFGTLADGRGVTLFTLSNASGLQAKIINYGAIVVSLSVPDRRGHLVDVVLGYDDLAGYVRDKAFLGAVVGRYGNRIARGKFTLDGKSYQLRQNAGRHHMHGGAGGFFKALWHAEAMANAAEPALKLALVSKDGEEGYPGTVTMSVTYSLTTDNGLRIDYEGTTDKPTILNPTHHSYFNLSGDPKQDILDEELMINAAKTTEMGPGLIPTGNLLEVADTPMDFRRPTKIGRMIATNNDQLKLGRGYDHNWVLNDYTRSVRKAAELYDATSGIVMDLLTDQPGVQFYSGNFLSGGFLRGKIHGKNGVVYRRRTALCLETQFFPNSPNVPAFPSPVLRPGEVYRQTTIYKFSTR